jgi:hypothetical protein
MSSKTSSRRWVAVVAAALVAVVLPAVPAHANGTTSADGSGVDYDAACIFPDPAGPPPPPNSIQTPSSPGGSWKGGSGCDGVSTYDGSTASTDILDVSLSTNGVSHGTSTTQLIASCTLDGSLPPAGSTTPVGSGGIPDRPDDSFTQGGCNVMFQNIDRQNNTPYLAGLRAPFCLTPVYGLDEHWQDGFHFFIGFDVFWDGAIWAHSAKIGTYDPSPSGGFLFKELGTSTSPNSWSSNDPLALNGTNWSVSYGPGNTVTVTADGVIRSSNPPCGGIEAVYAKTGDRIRNVKGLSTVGVYSPVGGYVAFSDTTPGNSIDSFGPLGIGATQNANGLGNIHHIAYTPGRLRLPWAGGWRDLRPDPELIPSSNGSMPDTLGRGPRCWTYTMGGQGNLQNPLWTGNAPCHIDDDSAPITATLHNADPGERGTFFPEFWDTEFGFTA